MTQLTEEQAYAEIIYTLFENPDVITHLLDSCRKPNEDPLDNIYRIGLKSEWVLKIDEWWFMVYRTHDGIGAKMILGFLTREFMRVQPGSSPPVREIMPENVILDYFVQLGADERERRKEFRKKFQEFLKTQAQWGDQSYGGIAARGLGPGLAEGSG